MTTREHTARRPTKGCSMIRAVPPHIWQVLLAVAMIVFGVAILCAQAQAHEVHGINYTSWVNKAGKGCCNNMDCRPIKDADVQFSPSIMVRIEGQWCPVLPVHYLKKGNAPDWNSNHVCVVKKIDARGPCERLLCFQPKPLF